MTYLIYGLVTSFALFAILLIFAYGRSPTGGQLTLAGGAVAAALALWFFFPFIATAVTGAGHTLSGTWAALPTSQWFASGWMWAACIALIITSLLYLNGRPAWAQSFGAVCLIFVTLTYFQHSLPDWQQRMSLPESVLDYTVWWLFLPLSVVALFAINGYTKMANSIMATIGIITLLYFAGFFTDTGRVQEWYQEVNMPHLGNQWWDVAIPLAALFIIVGVAFGDSKVNFGRVAKAAAAMIVIMIVWPPIDGWLNAPSTPRAPTRYAYAPAKTAWAANTNPNCDGNLKSVELTTHERKFNPNGCFYYAYIQGPVIFSGPMGTVKKDPNSGTLDEHKIMYTARTKSGTMIMPFILCSGRKANPNDGKWSCS